MSTKTIQSILSGALMAIAAAALADTYTPIDFPGALTTDASGINSRGEIVGTYTDAGNVVHGFRLRHGVFSTIDYPGAINTTAIAVNASGDIAGFFLDAANHWHGFVLSDGRYFAQDYPGATTGTFTLGIGANGTLVGEIKTGRRSACWASLGA